MAEAQGFFGRLRAGLAKTRANLMTNLEGIFSPLRKIDAELLDELEETLIMADVGVETSSFLMDRLKKAIKEQNVKEPEVLRSILMTEMAGILSGSGAPQTQFVSAGKVYLIVGVNGVGKTTTIAKLSAHCKDKRLQTLMVAGDTFRAAATEQLVIWGERLGIPVIHHQEGADPAAVVFDGMAAAVARGADVVMVDTAGRLHTKINLMEELKKIQRIVRQNLSHYTLETILVLDATTGQNAVNQTKIFNDALGVNGIILTKLDGTAKGGIVLSIARNFHIPIRWIGVGEKKDDLQEFDPAAFARALFEQD